MIRYALRCKEGHDFDGWFRSSEGYEALRASAQISCTICGATDVDKALMAPRVAADQPAPTPAHPLSQPRDDREAALRKLRDHVEAHSDYVGLSFAEEARAMHQGHRESRAIHGEARLEDARALIEEGVPIAPLPFTPKQKAN